MIRRACAADLPSLIALCGHTAIGCRALAPLVAYGEVPFIDAWVQEEANGMRALLTRMDGAATLWAADSADIFEISEMLSLVGFARLLCEERFASALPFPRQAAGVIFAWQDTAQSSPPGIVFDPSPRLLHPILSFCAGDGMDVPPFDAWYVDACHRARRNLFHSAVVYAGHLPVCCAMTTSETGLTAVIGGVACLPDFRRRGLASLAVTALCRRLAPLREHIALLCYDQGPLAFYENIGFAAAGRWQEASG